MRMSSPLIRSMLLSAALATGLVPMANADSARDSSANLAPPGPCAEKREALRVAAPSSFSVVGPLQPFFNPADVAAAPAVAMRPVPAPPSAMPRPGACDQPGAGCSQTPRMPVVNPPIIPGTRPTALPIGAGSVGSRPGPAS